MGIAQRLIFLLLFVVYSHGQRIPQSLFEPVVATAEQLVRIQELETKELRTFSEQKELSLLYASDADYQKAYDAMEPMADSLQMDFDFQYLYGGIAGILATELPRTRSLPYVRSMKSSFEQAASLRPDDLAVQIILLNLYAELPWVLGGSNKKAERQTERIKTISVIEGHLAKGYYNRTIKKNKEALVAYLEAVNLVKDCKMDFLGLTNNAFYHLAVLSFYLQKEVTKAHCFFSMYLDNYSSGDAYPKEFARYYMRKLSEPTATDEEMEEKLYQFDGLTAWIQNNFK